MKLSTLDNRGARLYLRVAAVEKRQTRNGAAMVHLKLADASATLPGVVFDLQALADGRQMASPEAALSAYAALLLPERDVAPALAALKPLVDEENLSARLAARAPSATVSMEAGQQRLGLWGNPFPSYRRDAAFRVADTSLPARVVGVLLGSPEFQRR